MNSLSGTLIRCIGMLLVFALLAPSIASAKPLTPEAVHARILKRGLGNWVGVQLQNGVAFGGRVVSIDEQSFGLQLHNDTQITAVLYSDVVDLRMGITRKGFWIIAASGIGAMVAISVVSIHEMNKNKLQLPTTSTTPLFP